LKGRIGVNGLFFHRIDAGHAFRPQSAFQQEVNSNLASERVLTR